MKYEPSALRGIGWMVLAVTAWSAMMIIVRALSSDYTSFQILFVRTAVGMIILLPLIWRSGPGSLRTKRFPLHLLRTSFAYIGMLGLFIGISKAPLAEVVALSFTQPIFAVVLASAFFAEKLGARRLGVCVIGFIGVLIISRPSLSGSVLGPLIILGSAISYACSNLCIKNLTKTETPIATTLWVNILMCPLAGIPAFFYWIEPNAIDYILLCGVGVAGTAGIWCVTHAYSEAEIGAVAPLDFLRLPIVAIAGWLMFNETTEFWTLVGAVIIFLSGAALARFEVRVSK